MKKLTALILVVATLFTFCAYIPAAAEDVPDFNSMTEEEQKEFISNQYAGFSEQQPDEADGEEKEEEPADGPEEQEYFYITQAEFEKYRDDYFNELTTDKLLKNLGVQGKESLEMLIAPLSIPLVAFIPIIGGLAAGAALASPFIGISYFVEELFAALRIIINRDKMYEEFSTDWLYATKVYEYNEETDDYELTGYEILYKDPEDDPTLWSDCLPVAIIE